MCKPCEATILWLHLVCVKPPTASESASHVKPVKPSQTGRSRRARTSRGPRCQVARRDAPSRAPCTSPATCRGVSTSRLLGPSRRTAHRLLLRPRDRRGLAHASDQDRQDTRRRCPKALASPPSSLSPSLSSSIRSDPSPPPVHPRPSSDDSDGLPCSAPGRLFLRVTAGR